MDAPKCKLCGDRHWGMCPSNEEQRDDKTPHEISSSRPLPTRSRQAPNQVELPHERDHPHHGVHSRADPKDGSRPLGRPRIEDKGKSFEATKPWVALGMSRRTWYSRRKEEALRRAALKEHPLLMWGPGKEKE
jgi:hypothetical protein